MPEGIDRRDPGRPRRRRHHAPSRRAGREHGAADRPGRLRLGEPAALPRPRRPRARVVQRAPALRQRRASRSSCPSGRSPAGARCRASSTGPSGCSTGPRRRSQSLPLRGEAAQVARSPRGAARPRSSGRSSYVELYGAYAECEAIYGVDRLLALCGTRLDDEDRDELLRSTRASSTGRTTSPTSTCRRSCSTPGCAPRPEVARARARDDRLRRQVLAPERHLAAFDLENTLIASNVVESYAWLATRRLDRDDRLRFDRANAAARRRPCWRSTAATAATSCATSTAATRARRSTSSRRTPLRCSATLILTKSFPAAIRRVREHRALGHRTRADHRRARLRRRAAAPPVRRHRLRPPRR